MKKLGICIPYRNRKEHIEKLIPELTNYLNKQKIPHKFYVGHQVDDKLFNRGAMKNIAAHYAFQDGCDYIAWHDVDMVPHDDSCDYSYPTKNPIHIATMLSKYDYGLGYDQYFGGVVLFTKEQVEKTNGYSNDYWDWGQEDDDLFWRCYFEGYTTGKIFKSYKNRIVANFNGTSSIFASETNREISKSLNENHTISILFKADQQHDKVPIWLVGDKDRKFIEYPIIRKDGSWTWGLSFNNSRAVTSVCFDTNGVHYYNWAKRFENLWTWVTMSYNKKTKKQYLFINNELISNLNGVKVNAPFIVEGDLRKHDLLKVFLFGFCNHQNVYYKGQISEIKIYDKFFDDVDGIFDNNEDSNLKLHYEFTRGQIELVQDLGCDSHEVTYTQEDIDVIENILPYRREGVFDCLFHVDEGYVNGQWAKGETTARNEKRFVTEMQQQKINYKEEGFNKILNVTEVVDIDEITYPNTMFINTKMI
jgi:hypothetical protein